MSRLARRAEAVLVDAHLWVAVAAAGLTLYAAHALGLPADPRPPLLVLAATILIYAVDDVFDGRAVAKGRSPERAASWRVASWRVAVATAAAMLAWQLVAAPRPVITLVGLGGLPCLAYGLPVGGHRLRDLPGVKPFLVAVAVVVAVIGVPLAWTPVRHPSPSPPAIVGLGLALFALVLCNVCFFDLRDLAVDSGAGVRTVATCLGDRGTRLFCMCVCGFTGLALALYELPGIWPAPMLAALAATAAYAAGLPAAASRLGYAAAVDGVPVLLGMSVLLRLG